MLPYIEPLHWSIGPVTIQGFGLMFGLGFLLATILFVNKFRTSKDRDIAYNIAIIAVISGILGGRLLFLIENSIRIDSIVTLLNFWEGGLSWFGGFLGGIAGVLAYIRLKGISFWRTADSLSSPLALAHAFGRIGCIIGDGGHVGKLTSMPWGFNVNGESRHVTAWYDMISLLILFFVLRKLEKRRLPYDGFLFQFYMMYYSSTRFTLDFLRIDPTYYGLTVAQYFCIGIFLISSIMLFVNMRKQRRSGKEPVAAIIKKRKKKSYQG